jgi:serine/threonine-protein kinase ULK2
LVPQPNQRSGTPGLSYQHAIQDGRPSGSPGSLQSHSLARAISSASLRWFGSSPVNVLSRFSGRPWARARTLTQGTEDAAAEDELLDYLGDIARKATVLFEFADSKLALCVTALRTSPALGGLPAAIATDHSPANIPTDQPRARRRSSSGSTSSGDLTAARLEVLCAEALVLYLKALAFLQHGVERARKFWENSAAPNSGLGSSPDFNESGFLAFSGDIPRTS